MNSIYRPLIVSLLLLASVTANAADILSVYAVNYPLAYFAQRIGGDHINPVYPLPADIDPAFWEPDASDIAGFQQADLILLNGAGYAKWLKRVSLPRRKLVNTSAAFQHDYISVNETVTHQHGPGGDHTHTGTAFTTWLDFNQASMQAKVILQALEKARPEHADDFRQNFASLQTELAELDEAMKNIVSDDTGKLLIASHPVYQYLARRYHIKLKSVMWEPDSVPDNNQWLALQQLLEGHDASWMIWEGEPDAQSVARLQAMGISSLVFDPVADAPQQGDFISIMKRNLSEIAKAYRLK
jgi:zinc transport system substrate-binding protein